MKADASWLLLIHQLPARPAYLRVKVWRRVLRIGAIGLRGSVYVLPRGEETLEDFQWLTREIVSAGGEASVCEAKFIEGTSDGDLEALFCAARNADYAALANDVRALARGRKKRVSAEEVTRLRVRLEEIIAIDFFGASRRETTELLVASLENPHLRGMNPDVKSHQRRTWITRAGMKIDRMACAWLIRRFIDPAAKLRYVDETSYVHTPDELRFDMADGEFTHEKDDCSFQTMLRRFELVDPALAAIAEIVHDIDLKDDRYKRPEAAGLAHVIAGIASASKDDAQRLVRASAVLDDLYDYFAARTPKRPAKAARSVAEPRVVSSGSGTAGAVRPSRRPRARRAAP